MAKYNVEFDYFHDYESEQFAFYRIPKVLFTDDHFRNLSSDAKVLYGLMLDRMALSIKNRWVDEDGRVYIIFTLEQIMQYMNCGKDKGVKILAELDTEKGIGLIQRVKRGLGKPTIIYVKSFIIKEKQEKNQQLEYAESEDFESRSPEDGEAEVQTSEKPKSGVLENRSPEVGKAEVQSSEKPKSGLLENRSLEFGKTDINNTDDNENKRNENDSVYPSDNKLEREMDMMEEVNAYIEIIKKNIEYEHHMKYGEWKEKELYEELFDIICEIICVKRKTVKIGGNDYPYELVKSKFLKLNSFHLEYVISCMQETTTKIANIKAYMVTALYNAPSTMNHYYQQQVQHDLHGEGGA